MKIKKIKIVEIIKALSSFDSVYNKQFSMYIVLNLKKLNTIKEEIVEIEKLLIPSQECKDFKTKEFEIIKKYGVKNKENNSVEIVYGKYNILTEHKEEYTNEITALREENSDIISIEKSNIKTYHELMDEEIEVDIMEIPFECIPEGIHVKTLETLSDIIKF